MTAETPNDLPPRHVPNLTDILLWALLGVISWNVTSAISELRALRQDYTAHVIESSIRLANLEDRP